MATQLATETGSNETNSDSSLAFIPVGTPSPRGVDVSYHEIVVWQGWEDKWGERRPYETPYQEWVENVHEPTRSQLEARWEGMPQKAQISVFWRTPKALVDRTKRQFERNKELDNSFIDTQEYKIERRRNDILTIQLHINMIDRRIEAERTRILSREADDLGYHTIQMEVDTNSVELRRLINAKDQLMRMRDRLEGQEYDDGEGEQDISTRLINFMQVNNFIGTDGRSFNDDLEKAGLSGKVIDALPAGLK